MSTNSVSAAGITIQTFQDVVAEILYGAGGYQGLLQIYGPGLNVQPNSPDGQMVNIYAEGKVDVLEMLLAVATSFDPDQAIGILLDQRCAINGVFRMPGSFTQQQVTVTTSQAVNLPGLDTDPVNPFTVADGSGNQYQLKVAYSFPTGGSISLEFQAAVQGAITSGLNTITVPVTVLAGVTSVNNPLTPDSVGVLEESDPLLRIRRQNSVALPSKGWLQGMRAGLLNVNGVTDALALENKSSLTNALGMPPHSIWLIVAGTPNEVMVADAIYAKRNACVDWTNGGWGGAGTVTLSGSGIGSVAVASGGQEYDNPPTVEVVGTGTGAVVTATVVAGVITAFVVVTPGTDYTGTPTIILNPNTVDVPLVQVDGTIFRVYYDTPIPEQLWFHATLTAITGTLDKTFIKNAIFAQFANLYEINQQADTASIIAFIKEIAPNASVASEGVSDDNSSFVPLVAPTNVNYQFFFPSASNITIS